MKISEFKRWLKQIGVTIKPGKKHDKLYFNGKQSTLPRHAKELNEGLRQAIIKQLDIQD